MNHNLSGHQKLKIRRISPNDLQGLLQLLNSRIPFFSEQQKVWLRHEVDTINVNELWVYLWVSGIHIAYSFLHEEYTAPKGSWAILMTPPQEKPFTRSISVYVTIVWLPASLNESLSASAEGD